MNYHPETVRIKESEAVAYIDSNVVNPSVLQRLNINPLVTDRVRVEVEFRIEWDDQMPLCIIDRLYIFNDELWEEDLSIDTLELEQVIEQKGPVHLWQANARETSPDDDYYIGEE